MIYRLIIAKWIAEAEGFDKNVTPPVIEGTLTEEQLNDYNLAGYNCYYLPNYPKHYNPEEIVDGSMIDTFVCVFVDLDMKDYQSEVKSRRHEYATKEQFVEALRAFDLPPSSIIDSGGGVHAYWYVSDLDAMGYLRLQRRLGRHFSADPAIAKLYQLMRVPGTINWKDPDNLKKAEWIESQDVTYTSEDLDKVLPSLSPEDEAYCKAHFDKTHGLQEKIEVSDTLPSKWFKLAKKGTEAHRLFYGTPKDRSIADYRLAHLMYADGFSRGEALAVLCQTNKATDRVGIHRVNYADGIVTKVWLAIEQPAVAQATGLLTKSVRDLLSVNPNDDANKGKRFECDPIFDATEHGFRLGQVMGEVGGVGSGKTMTGFNIFRGFAVRNPDYIHLAVSLEQPEREYGERWKKMCADNPGLLDLVHILGNYNEDGTYRHLSLQDIEDYVKLLEQKTGKKVGAVMIDHIGVLKKETRNGENQGLIDICQYMKAFAVNTNTFLIMQSQAPREKAGIGDIELDKDAAYGTVFFEAFCDWMVTIWQPLKRCYDNPACPLVTAFKYCKIRHKNVKKDHIKEDVVYALLMETETELLRELTPSEYKSYDFYNQQAVRKRSRDKKREPGAISVITWTKRDDAKPVTEVSNGRDGRNTVSSGRPGDAKPSQQLPTKR